MSPPYLNKVFYQDGSFHHSKLILQSSSLLADSGHHLRSAATAVPDSVSAVVLIQKL